MEEILKHTKAFISISKHVCLTAMFYITTMWLKPKRKLVRTSKNALRKKLKWDMRLKSGENIH